MDKFIEYLDGLREDNGDDKICLFMDNLSSHTSECAKEAMREHGFRFVYNVPYSPDYNPIELVFSMVKRNFKALRAKKFMGLIQDCHEALVTQAVTKVRKKEIQLQVWARARLNIQFILLMMIPNLSAKCPTLSLF